MLHAPPVLPSLLPLLLYTWLIVTYDRKVFAAFLPKSLKGYRRFHDAGNLLTHREQSAMPSTVRFRKGSWLPGVATRQQQQQQQQQQQPAAQELFRQPDF
jgi:hypothetical protein